MTSGGARGRAGRIADPNALRRERDAAEWTTLPVEGRRGKIPAWPLTKASPREAEIWEGEWRRPQAVVWEARHQELEVASYVRALIVSEGPKANAADRAMVLRFMEDLGISQAGLARNHWKIAQSAPAREHRPTGTEGNSAKARLKLVTSE